MKRTSVHICRLLWGIWRGAGGQVFQVIPGKRVLFHWMRVGVLRLVQASALQACSISPALTPLKTLQGSHQGRCMRSVALLISYASLAAILPPRRCTFSVEKERLPHSKAVCWVSCVKFCHNGHLVNKDEKRGRKKMTLRGSQKDQIQEFECQQRGLRGLAAKIN